jgi:hypothetical protein
MSIWAKPFNHEIKDWNKIHNFPEYINHSMTVRRIKFQETSENEENIYHIATCANDATTRIFEITVTGM